MQINMLLCIIHKIVKVVYEKTAYEDTILVSENLFASKLICNRVLKH